MAMSGLIEISKKNPSLLEAAYRPVQCIIVSSLFNNVVTETGIHILYISIICIRMGQ